MKAKHQRLVLVGLAALAVSGAAALGFSALDDTMTYFYSPTDVLDKGVSPGQPIRLGGLVETGSVRHEADGLTLAFTVTDTAHSVPVRYRGLVPDLFREGQGVVAEGTFDAAGVFVAQSLLAKHDEKYMPPEVADSIKRAGEWRPQTQAGS
ncbi:cytochrome c maturation protein CcmE [Pedomonas mirosovicensis]|uniref:cytochrome c maturation protein CcmE n=1 Tax=Pedomonas mirosovicensis TaxID=2908641 RepID=UPI00216A2C76|nr:cytochrome c maturation protein CcmE [Pedomonas mirosovicensis]MCH8683782.1 cytochrome c maturation protein CcmE [Pedomonas mirosovicensis]